MDGVKRNIQYLFIRGLVIHEYIYGGTKSPFSDSPVKYILQLKINLCCSTCIK